MNVESVMLFIAVTGHPMAVFKATDCLRTYRPTRSSAERLTRLVWALADNDAAQVRPLVLYVGWISYRM